MKREEAIKLVQSGFEQLESALKEGKSDDLMKYLTTMSRFHNYSFRNLVMIWSQREDATRVAGFRAWQKLGRMVKKGEKGIAIFAPMPFKQKEKNEGSRIRTAKGERKSDEEVTMMGFKVVHVFDISQTEGDPLPEPSKVTGEVGANLERIQRVVVDSGIELKFEQLDGAHGYSVGGKVVIDQSLSDAEKFQTIAHELAHERLHQGERKAVATKTVKETEAEAVGFIVSQAFGLDSMTHCADYIQLYDGNADTLRESLSHIQKTAQWIIESINAIATEQVKSEAA
ncbi:ArdC-like ssDNA-binding domain-containing protein [Mariniblastus sp.]|nr:ArdC-like ssDNA-binding domain-containing protein [Mariniblastus sp.]